MTREETKKAIEVMQAYVDGKKIECRWKAEEEDEWRGSEYPLWLWDTRDYRIKPQPMKVTEEEKKFMEQIWLKNKQTGHVYAVLDKKHINDDFIDNHYFLDPDKQEWIEIESDSKERLRCHYNGGQS